MKVPKIGTLMMMRIPRSGTIMVTVPRIGSLIWLEYLMQVSS